MTLAISTIPLPIIRAIVGINSKMPETITASAATIEVAPADKPTAKAVIPVDIRTNPAPIPAIPMPSNANAAANPNIGTIKGFNR